MKKYIFMDVDGTLVDERYGGYRLKTKETLEKLIASGHELFVCTGRNYPTSTYNWQVPISGYVCSSGGLIRYHDEVVYRHPYKKENLKRAIELADKLHAELNFECEVKNYASKRVETLLYDAFDELTRKHWFPIKEYQGEDVYKMMADLPSEEALIAFKEGLKDIFVFNRYDYLPHYLEVSQLGTSKGNAIKFLVDQGYIKHDQVVAIGDSENDISMFKQAAISIAMGNASEHVKQEATYVCEHFKDDGFAKIFEKFNYFKENENGKS